MYIYGAQMLWRFTENEKKLKFNFRRPHTPRKRARNIERVYGVNFIRRRPSKLINC